MHLLNLALLQARRRPREAAREVRALLNVVRENEATVQMFLNGVAGVLEHACSHLNILDPEVGEEEIIKAVAAALAKLPVLSRSV